MHLLVEFTRTQLFMLGASQTFFKFSFVYQISGMRNVNERCYLCLENMLLLGMFYRSVQIYYS